MQKKLIALAIAAAATSSAFADTTFYGRIDTYLARANNGDKSTLSVNNGGPGGSYIAIKANEDLGGGMQAYLNWQAQFASDTTVTPTSTRYVNVGLNTGKTGSIQLGAGFTPTHKVMIDFTVDGLADWTGFGQVSSGTLGGWGLYTATMTNAVEYINTIGPVTIDAAYLPSEKSTDSATTTKKASYDLTASFAQGPVGAAVIYQQLNAGGNTKTTNIGSTISYGLKAVTLKGVLVGQKVQVGGTTTMTAKAWEIGAELPVGAKGAVGLGYSSWSGEVGTAKKKAARGLSASYIHSLGKRTLAYVAYGSINNSKDTDFGFHAESTPTANDKSVSLMALGMRHSF